jgi:hypothetical protein
MTHKNNTTVDKLWEVLARRFPVLSPEEQRAGIGLHRELSVRLRCGPPVLI